MKTSEKSKLSSTDRLKERMLRVKSRFPKEYGSLYLLYHPKEDIEKVRNTWNCRVMYERIVKNFEAIADKIKPN